MKEQLQIVLRKNRRSDDLIQVARKIIKEKIIYSYQEKSQPLTIDTDFNKMELFELKWFDQMIKFFTENAELHATDLERYRLFLPESLYQAMFNLWIKCEENNIDYRPMDSMIKSLINKIKVTEKKIYEKTGEQFNALKDMNFHINMTDYDKDAQDAKTVFSKLITIPDFFNLFNEISYLKYRKSPNIKEDHFKGYAKAYHLPPKWVYACAIDVIAKYINPLSFIEEDCLFVLWIKPCFRVGVDKDDIIDKLKKWGAGHIILDKAIQFEII